MFNPSYEHGHYLLCALQPASCNLYWQSGKSGNLLNLYTSLHFDLPCYVIKWELLMSQGAPKLGLPIFKSSETLQKKNLRRNICEDIKPFFDGRSSPSLLQNSLMSTNTFPLNFFTTTLRFFESYSHMKYAQYPNQFLLPQCVQIGPD